MHVGWIVDDVCYRSYTFKRAKQDWLHNLGGPGQNENLESSVQN